MRSTTRWRSPSYGRSWGLGRRCRTWRRRPGPPPGRGPPPAGSPAGWHRRLVSHNGICAPGDPIPRGTERGARLFAFWAYLARTECAKYARNLATDGDRLRLVEKAGGGEEAGVGHHPVVRPHRAAFDVP